MDHEREEATRLRGYHLWQESGGAHGHDLEHWNRAEQEIEAEGQPSRQVGADRVGSQGLGCTMPFVPISALFATMRIWADAGRLVASMPPWSSYWSRGG